MIIKWLMILNNMVYQWLLVGGFNLALWKIVDFVSRGDDIPNIWRKNVPNHQPVKVLMEYHPPMDWGFHGI